MNAATNLQNAHDYLEMHGWSQGPYTMSGLPFAGQPSCAQLALTRIGLHQADWLEALNLLSRAIPKVDAEADRRFTDEEGRIATPVVAWNDTAGRTKEQVLAAFKQAIQDARGTQ